jgi:hypothetical protein
MNNVKDADWKPLVESEWQDTPLAMLKVLLEKLEGCKREDWEGIGGVGWNNPTIGDGRALKSRDGDSQACQDGVVKDDGGVK